MSRGRASIHVLLPGFGEACRGRALEELMDLTAGLSAVLARHASPWRTPAAGEADFVGEPPWIRSTPPSSPLDWGASLRDDISSELGWSSSVGIAATEFAARLAARLAGPRGVLLWMPGRERDLIEGVPVEELDELRPEQIARLRSEGIETLDALAELAPSHARTLIGVEGDRLVGLVRDAGATDAVPAPGRGPEADCARLAARLSRRLEREGARARGLELAVDYADGVTRERHCPLPRPTSASGDLAEAALHLYHLLPRSQSAVVGLSLGALGLDSPERAQLDLFGPSRTRRLRVALGRARAEELRVDTTAS